PQEEYTTLIEELELFSPKLLKKSRAIALTKMDSVADNDELDELQKFLEEAGETVFRVSSVSKNGIPELLHYLGEVVKKERLLETETPQEIEQAPLPVDSIWDDFS
ncbi:MAG: EutP/PduV family microcompartment system protein, partial [bacterium]